MIAYNNEEFLKKELTFTNNGRLIDHLGNRVMMDWEDGIMKDAASLICRDGGKILNIGFGLGIIDTYIQSYNIQEHWIIEAHPQVIHKMKEDGWDNKPNVTCIFDDWKKVFNELPSFDGIYFDTHAESCGEIITIIPDKIKPGGKFLYFDGHIEQASSNFKPPNYTVEKHITNIKHIDSDQLADGRYYWNPKNKQYHHHLIIKNN